MTKHEITLKIWPFGDLWLHLHLHSGGEVARFCREHFVKVLTKRDEWAQGDIGKALTETFFQLGKIVFSAGLS